MKSKKDRNFKKLRKARIWPSVIFLFISIALSVAAFILFVSIVLTNQLDERLDATCTNAVSVFESLDTMNGYEEFAISKLRISPVKPEAVFVADGSGKILAGYGEATYEDSFDLLPAELFGDDTGIELFQKYSFLYDRDCRSNLINRDGELLFGAIFNPGIFRYLWLEKADPNEDVFHIVFWMKSDLSGDRVAWVKCDAPIYAPDFFKAVAMGSFAFLLMLFPIFFFFINMLISFANQRRMTRLIYTDAVTGGNSYLYFKHTAGKMLGRKKYRGKTRVIADITILKYRNFCNYHGIHAGEALLETVDQEICSYLGKRECCAHTGRASFALFLLCTDTRQAKTRIDHMIRSLTEKMAHDCIVFHAGIYFCDEENSEKALDAADCFTRASAARVSNTDKNAPSYAVYDDKLLEEQLWTHKVEEKMHAALDREEFKVYIQPKYDPVTEKLSGAEALIRWVNDEDGFISPGRFIPIFENNGFITKIDDYMLAHVAQLQAKWLSEGKQVVPISVNVSRAHFANPDLAKHICSIVDEYEVPHHLIEIELTESAFFDDKAALLKTVHELKDLGFEISMDDFGAGYSSLNSLKDLPLDVLKLDAEFFRGEAEENRGEIVVSQAIQLAKSLHMRIVAEGVEKKEQVDFLAGQGCDMIQGFYFAKPMPAEEYADRLS